MGLLQNLRRTLDANRVAKARQVTQELRNALFNSPICSDYENVFAQVRPLIDEMASIMPYGIDERGERLDIKRTPELALLYAPNKNMGGVEFLDTMFAGWLTENQLYIHAHKGQKGEIIGYTIIPAGSYVNLGGGNHYWQVQTEEGIETLHDDEVMTLCYSRNPRDLGGVSPASAVRVFAQIDDLLAQFEKAYLENGAIPASITIIRASTQEKFNEARANLEGQLKGASNRNKTIYLWRQFNNDDGTERDQVEVKTIQGNNNTLAIQELANIVNDRLNKAYGVSNFILGDDSSAKYDNAELSDYQFTRRRVKPALRKFWSEFKHELDRITGGLGYDIRFKIDMPELTDRKRVEAETSEKVTQNLIRLISAGSKPIAACQALNLDIDKWQRVAVGIYNRVLSDREYALQATSEPFYFSQKSGAKETETAKETDTKQEGTTTQRDQKHHHDHCCEHSDDYFQPFTDAEKVEKKIFNRLVSLARAIFAEQPNINLAEIQDAIFNLLEAEANRGGNAALEAISRIADDDIEKALREILANGGAKISDRLGQDLRDRVNQLVNGYDQHTREIMRATLESSEGLTAEEIKERLSEVLPKGKAATIARNETVFAFKSGRLELDQGIADKYNLQVELVWRTSPEAGPVCPACAAMDGKVTKLGKPFTPQAATVEKVDKDGNIIQERVSWEPSSWNDYGLVPNAHTNCKCYFDEQIVRKA